jgi:hypothetical protein
MRGVLASSDAARRLGSGLARSRRTLRRLAGRPDRRGASRPAQWAAALVPLPSENVSDALVSAANCRGRVVDFFRIFRSKKGAQNGFSKTGAVARPNHARWQRHSRVLIGPG